MSQTTTPSGADVLAAFDRLLKADLEFDAANHDLHCAIISEACTVGPKKRVLAARLDRADCIRACKELRRG